MNSKIYTRFQRSILKTRPEQFIHDKTDDEEYEPHTTGRTNS